MALMRDKWISQHTSVRIVSNKKLLNRSVLPWSFRKKWCGAQFRMKFTIVYASATGHTEDIAERLDQLLPDSELKELDELQSVQDMENCEALICCTPTWNTGSDVKRSGTSWDEHIEAIPTLDCSGKPVAIVGLGDSAAFSKFFCDAMEELYTAFKKAGGNLIGHVSGDGYIFDDSKSMIDGMFCGLPIDEDNESEKTQERLESWCKQLLSQVDA